MSDEAGEVTAGGDETSEVTSAEVRELTATMDRFRRVYDEEALKRDRRIALSEQAIADSKAAAGDSQRVAGWSLLVGLVAVLIGVGALFAVWGTSRDAASANRRAIRAEQALAATKRQLTANRVAGCDAYNAQQDNTIAWADAHDVVLADLLEPSPRTAAVQAQVESGLARLHNSSVKGNPHRLCTPDGLACYYDRTSPACARIPPQYRGRAKVTP